MTAPGETLLWSLPPPNSKFSKSFVQNNVTPCQGASTCRAFGDCKRISHQGFGRAHIYQICQNVSCPKVLSKTKSLPRSQKPYHQTRPPWVSKYIQIFPNISKHFQIFPNISKYFQIFPNISKYIQICSNISKYFQTYPNISSPVLSLLIHCNCRRTFILNVSRTRTILLGSLYMNLTHI